MVLGVIFPDLLSSPFGSGIRTSLAFLFLRNDYNLAGQEYPKD
jgi:hypothetical protein